MRRWGAGQARPRELQPCLDALGGSLVGPSLPALLPAFSPPLPGPWPTFPPAAHVRFRVPPPAGSPATCKRGTWPPWPQPEPLFLPLQGEDAEGCTPRDGGLHLPPDRALPPAPSISKAPGPHAGSPRLLPRELGRRAGRLHCPSVRTRGPPPSSRHTLGVAGPGPYVCGPVARALEGQGRLTSGWVRGRRVAEWWGLPGRPTKLGR